MRRSIWRASTTRCVETAANNVARGARLQLGEYPRAIERFRTATNVHGYQADLAYSLALCHYQLGELEPTMRYVAEIVERGVKDHPG